MRHATCQAAGAALAEEFLVVWAKSHNPEIPENLRRKYGLPEDARIPVTPIMMEKNINSLARMMTLFRDTGLAPEDYSQVVTAFDLAYSTAETYRTSHIEKVFGPMNQMDEPVFSLILKQMNANLGERWRKMEADTPAVPSLFVLLKKRAHEPCFFAPNSRGTRSCARDTAPRGRCGGRRQQMMMREFEEARIR